ncbi:hypothetical protein L208DRAFT_1400880 [Tricholoma matsutake]|nr:hypothetical protein L208DRAFT_1400880 [Tricholoma matsutake 945]
MAFPAQHSESSKETEKDHNRERELNKKHVILSRPSSFDSHPSGSFRHPRINSFTEQTREDSSRSPTPLVSPAHRLLRHHSFSNLTRANSPAGSSSASHDAGEESQEEDIIHERERNWNAPRQRWSLHGHGSDSPSRVRSLPSASSHLRSPDAHDTEDLLKTRIKEGEKPQTKTENSVPDTSDTARRRAVLSPSPQSTVLSRKESPTSTSSPWSTSRKQNEALPRKHLSPSRSKKRNGSSLPVITLPSTVHDVALTASAPSTSKFEYVKLPRSRTSLPPLELENQIYTGTETIRAVSPAHDARENDWTPDHYMMAKLLGKGHDVFPGLMDGHGQRPFEASHVEESRSINIRSRGTLSPTINSDSRREEETSAKESIDESPAEERTPRVRTIPPPPIEVSKDAIPWSPSASSTQNTPVYVETRLQKAASGNSPISVDPSSSALLREPSSTPSLSPPSPPQPTAHSVLTTPPRRSPFNSTHKFQTPSPPKGMPELPEPPSLSSDGEDEQMSFTYTSKHGTRSDFSAIKTPRPPGAWSSTPQQPPRHEESAQDSLAPTSDEDHENKFAAAGASLSSMPARTPAPPGAWMITPAVRRPLHKVRFDTQHSHTETSLAGQDTDSSILLESGLQPSSQSNNAPEVSEGTSMTPKPGEESTSELRQQLPNTPISPRSRTSYLPRKSPSIRVVDAFGREQLPEDMSLDGLSDVDSRTRRKTGVRILDATGRDMDGSEAPSGKLDESDEHMSPLNHTEALTRVRQGLSDLARGLDDIDRTHHDSQVGVRLHELNDASQTARETRKRLHSAESDARAKFETMRASMKNRFPLCTAVDRRLHFTITYRMWWGVLVLQLFIVFVMYRYEMSLGCFSYLTFSIQNLGGAS